MSEIKGKRVLVTGAGGFIGSHLAEELVRRGAVVRAMVHYNALGSKGWHNDSEFRNQLEIFSGDVTDHESVKSASSECEIVFHLAALIGIPYSYQAPASYVRTNIGGTLNILQMARERGIKVIHTSTSEVYGTARYTPINEAHSLNAQSPYSATKIGADKLAESFYLTFNTPVVVVRPFNTFGPRQSERAVIPTIIRQCLRKNADVIRLGDVSPSRDLNFVDNTVDGFIKAAEAENAVGLTFNLGSGREITIQDLALKIMQLIGRNIEIVSQKTRVRPKNSEVERLIADSSLAKQILNWQPVYSLEEGLTRTIEWFRKNPGVEEVESSYVI